MRTPGSESGTGKRTGSNTGTAPRADSTDQDSSRHRATKRQPTRTPLIEQLNEVAELLHAIAGRRGTDACHG
jgi:hypothetical protein